MAKVCCAAKLGVVAPGTVVLSSTETVLSLKFATIRSGLPSPLTSAAVTEKGFAPVAKLCCAAKPGAGPMPIAVSSSSWKVWSALLEVLAARVTGMLALVDPAGRVMLPAAAV